MHQIFDAVVCASVCVCAPYLLFEVCGPCCLRITARFFILALVAICRGCELLVEQPGSSLMIHCPYVQFLALVIQPLRWAFVRLRGSQKCIFWVLHNWIQNARAVWCFLCLFGLVLCSFLVFFLIYFEHSLLLSPMGAWGHPNQKPTVCFGTVLLACNKQMHQLCLQWLMMCASPWFSNMNPAYSSRTLLRSGNIWATWSGNWHHVTAVAFRKTKLSRNTRWFVRPFPRMGEFKWILVLFFAPTELESVWQILVIQFLEFCGTTLLSS